jgi:CubicO group peptidase (beta-lactamase class C family)
MWRLLAGVVLGASAFVPASAPDAAIEAVIDAEMPASGVPGVAYAVVADGEVT